METKDFIDLPPASGSDESEKNDLYNSHSEATEADSQLGDSEVKEQKLDGETLGHEGEVGNEDSQPFLPTESENDLGENVAMLDVKGELTVTVAVKEKESFITSGVHTEYGCLTVRDGSPANNHKRDGSPINKLEIDGHSISGSKRARMTVADPQPLVRVKYESLTRDSKQKLEELLQQWSAWHSQHCSSSHESNEVLESGEDTYFPALHVGLDKPSAVSFWMDNQTRNDRSKEFIPLDSNSVPLYDRGYSLALTSLDGSSNPEGDSGVVDSRCFNCGSYNHALKECPKPRDNTAVNNARKEHNKSRRKQNGSSRNPTRYYQDSPGGKYDGLRPGILGAETRQLLGLGELDPPPWLNRMREIGYPPGYLDPEDEKQPSGITIFGDEEIREEKEDGEILEAGDPELPSKMSFGFPGEKALIPENANDRPELPRKMSIEFPGINAPIPENADEWRWAAGPSSSDRYSRRPNRRSNYASSEPVSKDQYREQRWSRDYRDEGPPGCDPSPRYGGYESNYSSHSTRGNNNPVSSSPSFGRSFSDRGRWSPSVHEGSSNHGSYGSLPFSPPHRVPSPQKYGSASFENRDEDSRDYLARDSSSHRNRRR